MNLSFKHYYWRWLKNQCLLFLVVASLMTLARAGFTLSFGDLKSLDLSSPELKKAFLLGFRFDLMPLAYVNIVPFILLQLGYFLPGKLPIRMIRSLVVTLLFAGYLFIGWLYVFDYGFYSYFQDHLNVLFFGFFEDDTKALLISINKNYNLFLWGSLIIALQYGLLLLIKFLFSPFDFDLREKRSLAKVITISFLGILFLAFAGRGNFSRLPLSIEDAHISQNEFINEISLNGALTLNRAIKIRKTFGRDDYDFLKVKGFASWGEAYKSINGATPVGTGILESLRARTKYNQVLAGNPPHVVLVVMESFGSYWNDLDSEKFQILGSLKDHFKDGILFKNFLPSENGTIGSIVSVTTGQVIRPGARFLSESEFMRVKLSSAGHLPFKEKGYETHFVYGGKIGWRDLGKFLSIQGYDRLWGAEEIKEALPELNHLDPKDLGNEWGIFDEYLYGFIDEQLRTATKPQLFVVLTTSNHPPFEHPSSYQPKLIEFSPDFLARITVGEELARKRFIGLQYANEKMSEFLTKIQQSRLRENTIVALTGDHSFWIAKGVGPEEEFKRYAVPFFLSVPEKLRPQKIDENKFGSHEDIFPTLFHLALSDVAYIKLGEDLFSESSSSMNSSGLYANEFGAYHHQLFWQWKNREQQILSPVEKPSRELESLKHRSDALIGLTDAYLKSEKKRKPSVAGSDRP
jgi:phosphoglycerol transferase MdoB-like AlkP superfamily enzyme